MLLENFGRTLLNWAELDWSNLLRFVCFAALPNVPLDRADGPYRTLDKILKGTRPVARRAGGLKPKA
jgi:hypothetical protein